MEAPRQAFSADCVSVSFWRIKRAMENLPSHARQLQEANALYRAGRLAEARALAEQVVARRPSDIEALHLAGTCALYAGAGDTAAGYFERVVALDPKHVSALYNLGNALMVLHRYGEAEARYAAAIALQPKIAPIHTNRGAALAKLGRADEAMASYDTAIALKPDFFEALRNRAGMLHAAGRLDEAIAAYDRVLEVNPRVAETLALRGDALLSTKRYTAAVESYSRALDVTPDYGYRLQRLHARMAACIWDGFDEEVRLLENPAVHGLKNTQPYPLFAVFDSPEIQRAVAIEHAREKIPHNPLGSLARRARGGKIRIGYFSPDFHNHPVSHLLVETLECHDRQRFEVTAFSFGPKRKDDLRSRLQAACDSFRDVQADGERAIAAGARDMAIDIAVDLSGYTAGSRPAIFAHRAAPVQVNYLGYPGTLGAPFMDYLIADRVVVPDDFRAFYTEKVVTLPHCYQPGDRQRAQAAAGARETYGLPRDGVVFCAFHNTFKITPVLFDRWMNILRAVSGSVLWLRFEGEEPAANLRREAVRRGIDEHRLVFAHHVPMAEHMARHRLADLFLDTFPYNAHSTTNDALWMGLPAVTLMGRSYAARVAASLLTAAGLPELITHSHDAYQALAVALAGDPTRRAALADKLAARESSRLFDTPAFTRYLEAAYTGMMERHDAGLAPDHFHVAP